MTMSSSSLSSSESAWDLLDRDGDRWNEKKEKVINFVFKKYENDSQWGQTRKPAKNYLYNTVNFYRNMSLF